MSVDEAALYEMISKHSTSPANTLLNFYGVRDEPNRIQINLAVENTNKPVVVPQQQQQHYQNVYQSIIPESIKISLGGNNGAVYNNNINTTNPSSLSITNTQASDIPFTTSSYTSSTAPVTSHRLILDEIEPYYVGGGTSGSIDTSSSIYQPLENYYQNNGIETQFVETTNSKSVEKETKNDEKYLSPKEKDELLELFYKTKTNRSSDNLYLEFYGLKGNDEPAEQSSDEKPKSPEPPPVPSRLNRRSTSQPSPRPTDAANIDSRPIPAVQRTVLKIEEPKIGKIGFFLGISCKINFLKLLNSP